MLAAGELAGLTPAVLAYGVAGDQAFTGDMDKTASRPTVMPRLPAMPRPLRPRPCGCSPTTASLLTIRRERASVCAQPLRIVTGQRSPADPGRRQRSPADPGRQRGHMLHYPTDGAPAREVAGN